MRVVIEVGGWEHACCGAAYDRDATVEITCREHRDGDASSTRHVESRHELAHRTRTVVHRGRVADVAVVHPDGSVEPIHRLPGGPALRGVDADDDGHLEQPWNGRPVVTDSDRFLVTLLT